MRTLGPTVKRADLRIVKLPPKTADPFYFSAEWATLKAACFKRDGGQCTIPGCGKAAVIPDHIISRRRWFAERLPGSPDTLDNLRSLCREHDNRFKEDHTGARRGGGG